MPTWQYYIGWILVALNSLCLLRLGFAYDFFWSELSVIQEDLLGFLFREHGFFCQRSDAYSHATRCK